MKKAPAHGHSTLHWRHNGHDSVSNHQPHDCLLNRLFRRKSKKISKLRVTGICGRPVNCPHKWPVTRKMFPFDAVIMISPNSHDPVYPKKYAHGSHFITRRPRQNGRQFADDTFEFVFFDLKLLCILDIEFRWFFYKLLCILDIEFRWFFSNGAVYNKPSLIRIMAMCRTGNKLSSEPMMAWCHWA